MIWSIWIHRNECVFQGIQGSVNRIIQQARAVEDNMLSLESLPQFKNLRFLHPLERTIGTTPRFIGVHMDCSHVPNGRILDQTNKRCWPCMVTR